MNFDDWTLMWLAKHLVDIGIYGMFVVMVLLVLFFNKLPIWYRQRHCKHPRVWETMACDAVCVDCRKNLGFIGTWRDQQVNRK